MNLDTREAQWELPSLKGAAAASASASASPAASAASASAAVSEKPKPEVAAVVRRLLSFAQEDKLLVWCGAACVLLSSAFDTAVPNYSARALALIISDETAGGGNGGLFTPSTFHGAMVGLVVFAILSAATTAARVGCSALVEVRLVARIQERLFASILRQELSFFDAQSSGALTSRLTSDVTLLSASLTTNVNLLLQSGTNLAFSLIVMLSLSIRLALFYVAASLAFLYLSKRVGALTRTMQKEVQDATSAANGGATQAISLLRTVRSLNGEGIEISRYAAAVGELRVIAEKLKLVWTAYVPAVSLLNNALLLGTLWAGHAYVSTPAQAAGFASFFFYSQRIQNAMGTISTNWASFLGAIGAGDAVFALLDREPLMKDGAHTPPPSAADSSLEFVAVTFGFPGRPQVLKGISLSIPAGARVAIVGRSGGGKSTLLSLALRLYAPDSGLVRLGGLDCATLSPAHIRTMLGAVGQEPPLFALSVRDNILYAAPPGAAARLDAAVAAAHLLPVLSQLPSGLDTMVGERGVRLSGGQKQRVALARALVRAPRLLLLDEATSALDGASEVAVQASLEAYMEASGGGCVLVAHRLSTVREMQRICVLEGGVVGESGSYAELLDEQKSPKGLFRTLVAQAAQRVEIVEEEE